MVDPVRAHLLRGDFVLGVAAAQSLLDDGTASRAALYGLLGRLRFHLGQLRGAREAADRAIQADPLDPEARFAAALVPLAEGQPAVAREALGALLTALRLAGDDSPVAIAAEIEVGTALADATRADGDPAGALGLAARALAFAERHRGPRSPEAALARHALARAQLSLQRPEEAAKVLNEAIGILQAVHPGSLWIPSLSDTLGASWRQAGQPARAIRAHREAVARWEAALGPHAAPLGASRHGLAQALHRAGDFAGARDEMARALQISTRTLGDDHVDTWISRFELGRFEVDVGLVEEGLGRMSGARKVVAQRLGEHHPVVKAMDRWL